MPSRNRAIHDANYNGYRIFCGDLDKDCTKEDLEKEANYYGQTSDVWLARGRRADFSGKTPLFGFVVYKYAEDAEKAVDDLHGREVCGRRIRVEHAFPYDPHRRRGGGGGGGRGPPPPRYSRPPPRYDDYDDRDRNRGRSRSRSYERRDRRKSRSRSRSSSYRSRSRSRDRRDDRRRDRRTRSRSRDRD